MFNSFTVASGLPLRRGSCSEEACRDKRRHISSWWNSGQPTHTTDTKHSSKQESFVERNVVHYIVQVLVIWIIPAACLALLGAFWAYVSSDLEVLKDFKSSAAVDIATLQANTKGIETVPDSISRIEDKLKTLPDPSASMARLEERVRAMERVVYQTRAEAAGFKNPDIVPVSLEANKTFESRIPTPQGDYLIKYTILQYDSSQKQLQVRVDGRIAGAVFINNTILIKNFAAGTIAEIPRSHSRFPRLFVLIVDVPSPNHAILAIGPKTDLPSKSVRG